MIKLLVDKYRPNTLSDLILDNELQNILLNMIKLNKIPNIILYGPPGTGKTSTALCIANTIIEKKYYEDCVLEINASDNRCLEDIENITTFCKKKTNDKKMVILDEADILTKKSLKIIENLLDLDIIFIFTCNSKKSIIESIQSKCTILLFNKISDDLIINKLNYIKNVEKCEKDIDLVSISILSNGDFRKSINLLELYINDNNLNKFNIQLEILNLIKYIFSKDIDNIILSLESFINNNFNITDIIKLLIYNIKNDLNIEQNIKINILSNIYKSYNIICNGLDNKLQLYGLIFKLL